MRKLLFLPVLLLTLLVGNPAFSADLEKGWDAYDRGDYATALREWGPLAKQGDADAKYSLGLMYEKGKGVTQNDKTAVKWYTLAAEQRHAEAQYTLGDMYENGWGVSQNYETAVKWYTLAAYTHDYLERLQKKMSPSQIERAQALARECVKKNYKGC